MNEVNDIRLYDQDRRNIYNYTGQDLYSVPVLSKKGTLWGFNLFVDGVSELLGTFDSLYDIIAEMNDIRTTTAEEYYISGYSDYDGWQDWQLLCEMMSEGE